ncbi:hypothetical protein T4B_14187 [Trichinella pseudospiralis]|uniref:Uncharacterized protein n=1 Tax=Trichinella pseudospiralis TaxID=6337 RepID=A0A0V1GMS3_TRIPS|nr:hypothetical protein T4B_14187 [Trichinella pseudospiralis]
MPKLMKGATPNELIKSVTATPKHNATDFTSLSIQSPNGHGPSLENRSSKHRGYC